MTMVDNGSDDWTSDISRPCPTCLLAFDPRCATCEGKATVSQPFDLAAEPAPADHGWTFDVWRVCSHCKGRSARPAETSYPMFSSQKSSCDVCDRHDDPRRRPGYEHKTFATRAELIAFLAL